jgi:hypothetical protein
VSLEPSDEMCGADRRHALAWLARLEGQTAPRPAMADLPAASDCTADDPAG